MEKQFKNDNSCFLDKSKMSEEMIRNIQCSLESKTNTNQTVELSSNKLNEFIGKSENMTKIRQKCWEEIQKLQGLTSEQIIIELNKSFTNQEIYNEKINIRDAMIKANIFGILSEEQAKVIMECYFETESNEIHFHGVGSGHEVESFKNMNPDIFNNDMPIIHAFDKNYLDTVTNNIPYCNTIEDRNIDFKVPDEQKTYYDGTRKRAMLVLFNPDPTMEVAIINGLIKNLDFYTGILIIGEILTGHCIKKPFISKVEKCRYKLKKYYHEPGVHYNDINWNIELVDLRRKYDLATHNISQLFLINSTIVDEKKVVRNIDLLYKLQDVSYHKDIIFLMIFNIHVLENYDISYYLNNNELEYVNTFVANKLDELPTELVIRYFNTLRKHKNDYLIYLCFCYGDYGFLFGNVINVYKLLNIRTDMHIKKSIFYIILVKYQVYMRELESRMTAMNKLFSFTYRHCNVCFSKIKIQCPRCNIDYCSQECLEFDKKYLNHKELCYYNMPLEFYFDNDIVILVLNWDEYVNDGTLKEVLIKKYITSCKENGRRKVNSDYTAYNLKFIIGEVGDHESCDHEFVNEKVVNDLTIQNCKDMHDKKINVRLALIVSKK